MKKLMVLILVVFGLAAAGCSYKYEKNGSMFLKFGTEIELGQRTPNDSASGELNTPLLDFTDAKEAEVEDDGAVDSPG